MIIGKKMKQLKGCLMIYDWHGKTVEQELL